MFPADPAYAQTISRYATAAAERLVALKVTGPIRVRLRRRSSGGRQLVGARDRTKPTQGRHHPPVPDTAVPDRRPIRPGHRVVHDVDRRRAAPRGYRPSRVGSIEGADGLGPVRRHRSSRLHFHQARQTGIVFHMISSLTEHGRVGLTAVGALVHRRNHCTNVRSASSSTRALPPSRGPDTGLIGPYLHSLTGPIPRRGLAGRSYPAIAPATTEDIDRYIEAWPQRGARRRRAGWAPAPPVCIGPRAFTAVGSCYGLGSDRGSPNHGSTLLSKRVMAQIRSPARVRTYSPVPWLMPVGVRR